MLTQVEVVLTFESGRRHMVRMQAEGDPASTLSDAWQDTEVYLDDFPDGPTEAFDDDEA